MQVSTAAAAPRPVLKTGVGRNKASAPPDRTKQQDRHTTLGGLLLRAELAPDPLERMLAVCRVLLCLSTDLLRPGKGFGDTPAVILGHHYLSCRQLAEKHRGDPMQLFLQEICSHEPLPPTQHAKYRTASSAAAPAAARAGTSSAAAPAPAATLQLRIKPVAAARQQQGGLLAQLGGGARAGAASDGAPACWVECSFEGSATITFPRHAETYVCTLPTLVLASPLAQSCPLDFSGEAGIECEATGLSATLQFRPFKGGQVKGSVGELLGEGLHEVASVGGSWQGAVSAESADGSGILFEASQFQPPPALTINLAEPGPRAATRLWSALLESLIYIEDAAAGKEGKKAAELAAALPAHLRKSLMYEVESSGLKPRQQAPTAAAAEPEEPLPAPGASSDPAAGLLPPCVREHHITHGGLTYQLHYRVQAGV